MKSNAKFVAICLAVVFVLALVCGVLVACNEDADTPLNPDINGNNDEDVPESGSLASMMSMDELEHIIGYVATEGYKDGQHATCNVISISMKDMLEDMLDMPYKESYGKTGSVIFIDVFNNGYGHLIATCTVYVSDDESKAKALYDDLSAEEKALFKQEGKLVISESAEGLYKNTILKAPVPSTFSKTRMDFIKDCVKIGGLRTSLSLGFRTNYKFSPEVEQAETSESMSYDIYNDDETNCEYYYDYYKLEEGETAPTQEEITEMLKDYIADSYVDTTKETGYVFEKLIERTGLFYLDTTIYFDEGEIEGLEVNGYNYDKNTPKDLTVPATVGEKKVIRVSIGESNLVTITLSEGILQMDDFNYNDELTTISLPKSIKILYTFSCPFRSCPKFTTIKYAGSIDDWNNLVQANNIDINEKWCKYVDDGEVKTISFTVQCSNGSINYPA